MPGEKILQAGTTIDTHNLNHKMTNIQSDTVEISKPPEEVFATLSNLNNLEKYMPEQVVDWKSDEKTCSFTIKGMASLAMAFDTMTPGRMIKFRKDGKAPFDFFLICRTDPTPNGTALKLELDADLNPFLKMLAEKPLQNFLNLLVTNYKKLAES